MLDDHYWEPPSREEIARGNLEKVRGAMKAEGIDALIVNRSDNLRYVTGVMPTDNLIFTNRQAAIVTLTRDQPILFAASHYVHRVHGKFWITDVRSLPRVQETWPALFHKALAEAGVTRGTVLLDPYMFYATSRLVERQLKGYEVSDAGEFLARLRMIKSDDEIAVIESATALGEIALAAGFEAAREGITEWELAAIMSKVALAAGAEGLYARRGTLVSSGEKLAHHMESPTRKRLRRGEFVLMDVGPMVKGYYCDFARTVFLGDPTPEQRAVYRATHECLHQAIRAMRPGARGSAVDAISQDVIARAGFAEFGTPLVGHGCGTSAQEPPYIVLQEYQDIQSSEAKDVIFEPGMVISLSSGVFVPGVGGCRFEEMVVITKDGHRIMSRAPYPGFDRMIS